MMIKWEPWLGTKVSEEEKARWVAKGVRYLEEHPDEKNWSCHSGDAMIDLRRYSRISAEAAARGEKETFEVFVYEFTCVRSGVVVV